ncbi:acyl-CoA/acyl-ACP dehydrogenase [Streptomyces spinoverrucosus]|uniref:acyl-CoA dehydrogenase family protein n=1 Tax=Streptomyces spinoverrucosus TaxID=284043 RepID=UPI0018C44411|nr:acyl-CoA dehydrogenase family protein [Streptomyces spinoverrucosus]MBG0855760.1 acyl-CoA/acyl-ACP dehydrogenase [Streptomyces spinoverrucosus]
MDLTLSPDQLDLRAGLVEFLDAQWTPERLRAGASSPTPDHDSWRRLSELGLFGVTVPESAGGMGLGCAEAAILCEELGRYLVPGPLVPSLLAADRVPGVLTGDCLVALLDRRDPTAVAEHLPNATHLVVIEDSGLLLHPVEGLKSVVAQQPLDPLTPVAVLAGPLGSGERIGSAQDAARWREVGAVLTAALQTGVARGALELATQYATERVQFGRVIGSFQAIKHLLAEALVRVDLARAAVHVAALTLDDPGAGDSAETVAAAKVLADDAAAANGRTCVQVHGGMGFTWEVLAHLYLKRAWVQQSAFGSADEHALGLAERLPDAMLQAEAE